MSSASLSFHLHRPRLKAGPTYFYLHLLPHLQLHEESLTVMKGNSLADAQIHQKVTQLFMKQSFFLSISFGKYKLLKYFKTNAIRPAKFEAANFKHTVFNCTAWCCSAKARVVATFSTLTSLQSLDSHTDLSLSKQKRSAAANRCCAIMVSTLHREGEALVISMDSGRASR